MNFKNLSGVNCEIRVMATNVCLAHSTAVLRWIRCFPRVSANWIG